MRYRPAVMAAILIILSACATTPPKHFVHTSSDAESRIGQITRVAVIADVCIFKDTLGDDDYWVVEESRSAAGHMVNAASKHMADKGYEITYAQAPFVGAFKNREKPVRVCDKSGEDAAERTPPLFESETLAGDPEYKETLLKIIPKVPGARSWRASSFDTSDSDQEIKDNMAVIGKTTGGEATLFLIGNGTIVSAGKQLTQGLTTGLLTAALTLGTVSVSRFNVSVMDSYAVLVDNTPGEILWSNGMRRKGDGFTDEGYYAEEKWPRGLLYHMPAKPGRPAGSELKDAREE